MLPFATDPSLDGGVTLGQMQASLGVEHSLIFKSEEGGVNVIHIIVDVVVGGGVSGRGIAGREGVVVIAVTGH